MRDTFHRDPRLNTLIFVQITKELVEQIPDDPVDERVAQRRDTAIAALARMLPPGWTRPDRPPFAARTPTAPQGASNRDDVVVRSDPARCADRRDPRDEQRTVPDLVALPPNEQDSASA